MTDRLPNPEILKHMQHLENQNHRLRRLLSTTLDVANQDVAKVALLQEESKSLENTVDSLEREKKDLEALLAAVLSNNEGDINLTLIKLEREHQELRAKLDEALRKIQEENEEIENLKSEDILLKATIAKLESTKRSLIERIKIVEEKESVLSAIGSRLKQQLSEVEHREALITQSKYRSSDEKMQTDFNRIEDTYKVYVNALQQQYSNESQNEQKRELLPEILSHNSNQAPTNSVLSTAIKDDDLDSKHSMPTEALDKKVTAIEVIKNKLYDELEETIEDSSREINQIRGEFSDPDIRKLIHEIDVQKTVLMYNLRLAKLEDEIHQPIITKINSNPNPPRSYTRTQREANVSFSENYIKPLDLENKDIEINTLTESLEKKIADLVRQYLGNNDDDVETETEPEEELTTNGPSTSRNTQLSLDQMVSKLENERTFLLKQLHSVSAMTAQQHEERLLQTQSELHSTFMREISSENVVEGKNYDDATNQLYSSEEARLEQRIRELEAENDRIKKELDSILKQISTEEPDTQQVVQKLLKQGIDELEKQVHDSPGSRK